MLESTLASASSEKLIAQKGSRSSCKAHTGCSHRGIFYEGNSCAEKQTRHKPIIGEAGLTQSSEEMQAQLADSRTHAQSLPDAMEQAQTTPCSAPPVSAPLMGRATFMLIPAFLRVLHVPARTLYCSQILFLSAPWYLITVCPELFFFFFFNSLPCLGLFFARFSCSLLSFVKLSLEILTLSLFCFVVGACQRYGG